MFYTHYAILRITAQGLVSFEAPRMLSGFLQNPHGIREEFASTAVFLSEEGNQP